MTVLARFAVLLLAAHLAAGARLTKRRGHLRASREDPADYESMYGDEEPSESLEGESFEDVDYKPFENPDIIKKYDGLESVQETLFTIGCKGKHKLDVSGMAAEKSKKEGWKMPQMMKYVGKVHDAQIAQMKRFCGLMAAKSSTQCMSSCSARWAGKGAGSLPKQEQNCIDMCTMKHKNWEKECYEQVENLKNVYSVEKGQLTGAQHCVELNCPKFPQVTMINNDDKEAKLSEQQSVVDAGCEKMCTEEGIEATCDREFQLNIDFKMFEIEEKCQGEEKPAMDECMDGKKKDADADFKSCKEKDGGKCDSQAEDCMADQSADTMSKEEGQKFCDERKTMCMEQVSKHCSDANEAALKDATKTCKGDYDAGMKKCTNEETEKARKKEVTECVDKTTPTCKEDCDNACQLEDLDKCQADLTEAGKGVTQDYCEQFWQWLYDSERVNPANGDPLPKALAKNDKADGADLLR